MTPEQRRLVSELFHQALELPPEERIAWADRTCTINAEVHREVVSLLENDHAAGQGFVERGVRSAVMSLYQPGSATSEGQRVGPYKLLWELGRGGMGTVYLAERDDEEYHTKVAIKLVRPGMDTDIILHRFRRERQILAHLQHPNIARLLDGGTTDSGLPYIVMEFIEGARITEYCETHTLSIPERLTLFLDVCSAVEYAHRHFVVHRDLKPGNILVSQSGTVKLLDFGICKLLHSDALRPEDTAATLGMLTPEYASPEQVRGDPITAASDIYSLGTVLYEMLTGVRPHRVAKLTPQALERAICEQDVVRPSLNANKVVARRLEGDLDNILLRALQKQPDRRYPSVEHLAEDLRRHLTHQPVRARPDTLRYRGAKFARRHRGGLIAATAIVACLLAGMIISLREARIAKANLLEARRLANAFVFDVHDAVRELPGSTRARQLIAETGLRFLDSMARNSRGDWELRSELATAYQRVGDVQGNVMGANLGNTHAALESYQKALALLDSLVDHDPANGKAQLDRLVVRQRIGAIYVYTQDSKHALEIFRETQRLGEELLARDSGDEQTARQVAQIYAATGDALRVDGALESAMDVDRKAITLLSKFSERHPDPALQNSLAAAYSALGIDLTRLGRLDESMNEYKRALAMLERLTTDEPANSSYQRTLMAAYSHLGDVLGNPKWHSYGDRAGALEAYRRMLAVARRLYEADPANHRAISDYAIAMTRVAAALPARATAERLSMLRESVRLLEEIQQLNPQNVMNRWDLSHGYGLLGDALLDSRDSAGAIRAFEQSVASGEALLAIGVDSPAPDLVAVHEKLGLEAARKGNRENALKHARRALDISDPGSPMARSRAGSVQRFLTPRGAAAMGLTYAALWQAKRWSAQSLQDRVIAVSWLEKSLTAWRALQSDGAFAPPHKSEMDRVEAALVEVSKR